MATNPNKPKSIIISFIALLLVGVSLYGLRKKGAQDPSALINNHAPLSTNQSPLASNLNSALTQPLSVHSRPDSKSQDNPDRNPSSITNEPGAEASPLTKEQAIKIYEDQQKAELQIRQTLSELKKGLAIDTETFKGHQLKGVKLQKLSEPLTQIPLLKLGKYGLFKDNALSRDRKSYPVLLSQDNRLASPSNELLVHVGHDDQQISALADKYKLHLMFKSSLEDKVYFKVPEDQNVLEIFERLKNDQIKAELGFYDFSLTTH